MPVLKREKRRPYVFIIYKLFFFPTCVFVYHPPPLPQRFLFRQTAVCVVSKRHKKRRVCISCFSGRGLLHSHCSTLDRFRKYLMQLPSLFFWQSHLHPFPRRERERGKKLSISSPFPSFSLSLFPTSFCLLFLPPYLHTQARLFSGKGGVGVPKHPFSRPPLFLGCAK